MENNKIVSNVIKVPERIVAVHYGGERCDTCGLLTRMDH
jgi:hypothetical protein